MPPKKGRGGKRAAQPAQDYWSYDNVQSIDDIDMSVIERLFKINTPACTTKKPIQKNCPHNPNCLLGVGEGTGALWATKDEIASKENGPEPVRDVEICPAGLKNLGATCYMNSLFQSLFMNPYFRRALYVDWKETGNPEDSVVFQLQLLFGYLQHGKQSSFAPKRITELLNIRTGLQQDVQEFLTLFLSFLEEQFKKCTPPSRIIQQEFGGEYTYAVKCHKCSTVSERKNDFMELVLEIKANASIEQGIKTFLAEELLTGANQYACETCKTHQDASRSAKFQKLPPTLNIQLLRFVYLKEAQRKEKVNDEISFPHVLDLATCGIPKSEDMPNLTYDLTGILLHLGATTQSGHYVAHIKDSRSGQWYRFDDSKVEPLELSQVGYETALTSSNKKKGGQPDNQRALSRDAYMLIYTCQNRGQDALLPFDLPQEITDRIMTFNLQQEEVMEKYVSLCPSLMLLYQFHVGEEWAKRQQAQEIYNKFKKCWKPVPGQKWYWITTHWLKHFVSTVKVNPMDHTDLMCEHDKLSIMAAHNGLIKRISEEAWMLLQEHFGGGPFLDGTDMETYCTECVYEYCWRQSSNSASRLLRQEMIRDAGKPVTLTEKSFYVSKEWLAEWKQPNPKGLSKFDNCNATILCPHKGLSVDTTLYQRVAEKIWKYIKQEYPNSTVFRADGNATLPCAACMVDANKEKEQQNDEKKKRNDEKALFLEAFKKQSFSVDKLPIGQNYLVSQAWIGAWKKYLNFHGEKPGPIDNSIFIRTRAKPEGKDPNSGGGIISSIIGAASSVLSAPTLDELCYDPETEPSFFYAICQADFQNFQKLYGASKPIICTVSKKAANRQYSFNPPVSSDAIKQRIAQDKENALNWEDKEIIVTIRNGSKKNAGTVRVTTSASTEVCLLMLQIYEVTDIPPNRQRLYYKENELDPTLSLIVYEIKPGETIFLHIGEESANWLGQAMGHFESSGYEQMEEGFAGSLLQGSGEWNR